MTCHHPKSQADSTRNETEMCEDEVHENITNLTKLYMKEAK